MIRNDIINSRYVLMAAMLLIPAELCFTLYKTITSFYNAFGHVLKIVYYFFLFRGIFVSIVVYPYKKLEQSNIKAKEENNRANHVTETLNDILDALPVAVQMYGTDGRLKYINRKFEEIMVYDRNMLYGLTAQEIHKLFPIPEENEKPPADMVLESEHDRLHMIRTYKNMKGDDIKLSITTHRIRNGILVLFNEARKEQDLESIHLQTQTILNAINNGVILTDNGMKVIMCNKAFMELTEMEEEQVVGRNINDINKALHFSVEGRIHQVDTGNISCAKHHEASLITPGGRKKAVLFYSAPISNVNNDIIGFVGISSDITELKEEQSKIARQEKLAIIGEMGAGIVHETKNHLASIKGYCQLLAATVLDEKQKRFVDRIENIAADVNKVVVDFLALAKPADTVMDIISLNEVIEAMRYMLESPSFIKGVGIDIKLSNLDEDIKGDEAQIKQVILNLSKNAIEAMSGVDNPRLLISTRLSEDGKAMQLIVADNGKGISKDDLSRIGTPFFTTKEYGTGLGLSVCYRIIKEHGGRIDVQSEENKGTIFTITFPCFNYIEERNEFGALNDFA